MFRFQRMAAAAITIVTALVILAPAASYGQAAGADETAVLKADADRFTAMQKGDAAALETLLGAELSYTHSNAAVQNKADFISDIKTGKIKYLSVEPSDRKAQIFGNAAVVTGGAAVHVIQNGNDLTFKIRYTNTHVKRAGAWQMVAWQATRLPA